MQELIRSLQAMNGVKILVIGDLMLDTFVYGDVERISPESPVPVLTIRDENTMLGGAGNVISNLCALKVKPFVFAVTGNDAAGETVKKIAQEQGADVSGLLIDDTRPTTLKTRYLARQQQLLRTDFEKTHPLSDVLEQGLFEAIQKNIKDAKAVILSDYGKGVLSASLLTNIIGAAKAAGIPVLVDPKGHDYSLYKGADIVTPNRKELGEATGTKNLKSDAEIVAAAQKLIKHSGIKTIVATRSEDGLSVVSSTGEAVHLKTQAQEVFDVSGAGDTVIATLAAALAGGATMEQAARLANIAGGIAVSKVGTTPVRMQEILDGLEGVRQTALSDWTQAEEQVRKWKASGLRVGLTNGCFDILHAGHVNYLNEARKHCDRLIVALNHDSSVKILKGPSRPVNDEQARATVLGALGSVDMVVLFGTDRAGEDNTPSLLISKLRPDIFFKGGDYKVEQLPEAKIVQSYGGDVAIMKMHDGYSTTAIIEKSRKAG